MRPTRRQTIEVADVLAALEDATATFGDDTGRWRSTEDVADLLWVDYGRARRALEQLAAAGRVRQHRSGADYWQRWP